MRASAAASISAAVSSVSGRCRLTMSASASSASSAAPFAQRIGARRDAMCRSAGSRERSAPGRAGAEWRRSRPGRRCGRRVRRCRPAIADRATRRAACAASKRGSRRSTASISANVSSATARALVPGRLHTGMPRCLRRIQIDRVHPDADLLDQPQLRRRGDHLGRAALQHVPDHIGFRQQARQQRLVVLGADGDAEIGDRRETRREIGPGRVVEQHIQCGRAPSPNPLPQGEGELLC